MVIWKAYFAQEQQQLKLRFLLTQVFELITDPASFISFSFINFLQWKEVLVEVGLSGQMFLPCAVRPALLWLMALSPEGLCRSPEPGWWGPGRRWHRLPLVATI